MILIDSHAHLNDKQFAGDVETALQRAVEAEVESVLNVSYDETSSRQSVELAIAHRMVYSAVGIHPHDSAKAVEQTITNLQQMAIAPKIVAIGEIGLDYYRDLSPRTVQEVWFRKQLRLARELRLPVIIHSRDAHNDTLRILKEEKAAEIGGVMHCFSGSWEMALECLKMGFYISLAGQVTYKNAVRLQEIARRTPLDRLLMETDAPYLTPEPFRGRRNEPAHVRETATFIAGLRGISLEQLAEAASVNTKQLFSLPLTP